MIMSARGPAGDRRRRIQVGQDLEDLKGALDQADGPEQSPIALRACLKDASSRVRSLLRRSQVMTIIRTHVSGVEREVIVPGDYALGLDQLPGSDNFADLDLDVYREHRPGVGLERLRVTKSKGSLHDPDGKDVVAYEQLPARRAVAKALELWQYRQIDGLVVTETPCMATENMRKRVFQMGVLLVHDHGQQAVEVLVNQHFRSTRHLLLDPDERPCDIRLCPIPFKSNPNHTEMEEGEGNMCVIAAHPA